MKVNHLSGHAHLLCNISTVLLKVQNSTTSWEIPRWHDYFRNTFDAIYHRTWIREVSVEHFERDARSDVLAIDNQKVVELLWRVELSLVAEFHAKRREFLRPGTFRTVNEYPLM